MDSITQIALGASVAAAVGFKPFGRKSLLAGAFLGTLPDLDVFINYGNAVDNYTSHRGFSHSLFVLTALALVIYFVLIKLKPHLTAHKWPLFAVIFLPLITHPLLDTFTTYGTQLLWPLPYAPIAWHSIFIIDPLYTLPLLVGVILLGFSKNKQRYFKLNQITLMLSCIYLAWGQFSQAMITAQVKQDAIALDSRLLVMPTPFNSIYWRVLSYHQNEYYEAFTHLGDNEPLRWTRFDHNRHLIKNSAPDLVPRLEWFSHAWLRFDNVEGQLQVTDLRLGVTGYHPFSFVIAEQYQQQWNTIEPRQVEMKALDPQQLLSDLKINFF